MFQNNNFLLNFYNTREDFTILKMFVPHNRDSKPRKHCILDVPSYMKKHEKGNKICETMVFKH